MKVTFLGAAQTVTGSCYMIEAAGKRFTIDCGMFQGNKKIEERNFNTHLYNPENIDFILLTHAHIDHSGLLPRIGSHGFKGNIYCTEPTVDLVSLMLEDSAHIQEMEFEWKMKQKKRKGKKSATNLEVLYTMEEAQAVVKQLRAVEYDKTFEPAPNIKVTYRYVAHILGAAFVVIEATENGKTSRLTFSGDLGRPGALLLDDPDVPDVTDYLFVESTYGDRNHKNEDATLEELTEAINYSYSQNGKVIIPTFAVERAQEIIYSLYLLDQKNKIPKDMPIFLDSPLAIKATKIFYEHADRLEMETGKKHPFNVENNPLNIKFTLSTAESQALNVMEGPAIILSASGMCNAGRIKHHLKHNIWRPETSLVFVGYQAVGTIGRNIVEGAKNVRIFNESLNVAAKIFTIGGFSAHAGQSQIMDWINDMAMQNPHIVLIHGEPRAQNVLANLIREKYGIDPSIPKILDTLILEEETFKYVESIPEPTEPKATEPKPTINNDLLLQDIEEQLNQIKSRMSEVEKTVAEQTKMNQRLLKIQERLKVVSRNL